MEELVSLDVGEVRLMEQRMVGMRVSLVFGWSDEVGGRLAVLAVRE